MSPQMANTPKTSDHDATRSPSVQNASAVKKILVLSLLICVAAYGMDVLMARGSKRSHTGGLLKMPPQSAVSFLLTRAFANLHYCFICSL